MRVATSSSKFFIPLTLAMLISGAAVAESMPDGENGRYAMSATPDGVLRLDTRTGAMSTCSNSGAGWACYAIPDERAAMDAEIGRLQADNERLKAQLAAREPVVTGKTDEALPKSDALPKDESSRNRIRCGRPSRRLPRASARSKSRCRATATWTA